ncbi:glycosyltransferase [Vibrio atypicus]|uniref:glycosyltransferase n=1 Tax=Vibrio atypicus TaxID=558271 RepID=UPI0013583CDD|nr:glycosyltransferase [Vibrio atypicus]
MVISGFFDAFVDGKLEGWCVDADRVELSINGSCILNTLLDVQRDDLNDLTDITACGFSSTLDAKFAKTSWFYNDVVYIKATYFNCDKVVFESEMPVDVENLLQCYSHLNDQPLVEIASTIRSSLLWDEDYYAQQLSDDRHCCEDLVIDYLVLGCSERKQPNRFFSSVFYLDQNQDVRDSGINELYHYITSGEEEGRWPNPYFDPQLYLTKNQDLLSYDGNLLAHYSLWGKDEKRAYVGLDFVHEPNLNTTIENKDDYQTWCEFNTWNSERYWSLKNRLAGRELPKLSIVMPVYNPPMKFFRLALKTIEEQVYTNWELCIADDCSTDPNVREFLESYSRNNDKVKVHYREENGHISAATNSAASLVSGEFIVFMDQDDELTPDALAEIALYASENPEADVIYSDDDKNDPNGKRFAPQFKPDWSPELLLSYMYMCHIFCVRSSLYNEVGGTRVGYEGSQDYDLALRVTEKARSVGHIPKVLYHWRVLPGSTASSGNEKHYSFVAGINAVQDALDRRGINAAAYQPEWAELAGCGVYSHRFPDDGPSVAIIIPTKNQAEVTERLLTSLECTSYKNYRVYIINNESDEKSALELFSRTEHTVFNIPNREGRFSYAYVNNQAVDKVSEDYVLFLNNDTEVISEEWLSQMVGYLQFEGVGAVGARLLYPDDTVQHAGVLHNLHHGLPGHSLKHKPHYDGGYMGFAKVLRNYSCVTAACLLMPRKLFNHIGQFDEENFAVAYNDVDLCYRILESGQRVVYAPTAELYHHEGKSRGFKDNPREEVAFVDKYRDFKEQYYNPNLVNSHDSFKVKGRAFIHDEVDISGQRVAFFSHNLNLEGAPIQLLDIAAGLKLKQDIIPIFISPQDGPLRERLEALDIEVRIIPEERLSGINVEYNKKVKEISEWLDQLNVSTVFANTVLCFWAVDAADMIACPSVWIIHESEPPFTHIDMWCDEGKEAARTCLGKAYQVVFVSEATKELYSPLAIKQNYSVIYNGFDDELMSERVPYTRDEARSKLKIHDDEVFAIIVGTVCERKGQVDFVKAVGCLDASVVDKSRFAVIGDRASNYSELLHAEYDNLPELNKSKLSIVKETQDVGLYYAAADIFVCCSRIESFPRVIQEAMHCGLSILTTPVFGIAEQVKDEVSARFYTPGEVNELGLLLENMIVDRKYAVNLGLNAKEHLNRLPDYTQMIDNYSSILKESKFC